MITKVEKRDGRIVDFDSNKIKKAIRLAVKAAGGVDFEKSDSIADEVVEDLNTDYEDADIPSVEDVQDCIEKHLIKGGFDKTAKEFIIYRHKRSFIRERDNDLMRTFKDLTFQDKSDNNLKRENANIDSDTSMGLMLKYGSEASKHFANHFILKSQFSEAHAKGYIHIHDLDFLSTGTLTCTQIDLKGLFKNGFSTGHGYLRTPNSVQTASALTCIAIQANQNEQHGGQSIPDLDYALAPYVVKSFIKNLIKIMKYELGDAVEYDKISDRMTKMYDNGDLNEVSVKYLITEVVPCIEDCVVEKIYKWAYDSTDKDTYQAMEALVHNLNTMQSRAGAQIPFSSINFGTDTSVEGRCVSKNLLLSVYAGLGNRETAIFPVSIFKCKHGINLDEGDINYDLFLLACKVSAKRLFPNFSFLDAPFNLQYYRIGVPESEATYMGCVRGNSKVKYKIAEIVYDEDIETLYTVCSELFPEKVVDTGITKYVDISDKDIFIQDTYSGGFVQCLKVLRNPDRNNWVLLKTHTHELYATNDHPLAVMKRNSNEMSRVEVDNIEVGDIVYYNSCGGYKTEEIVSKERVELSDYSYDVETDSDRFDVNGLLSHNCRTRVMANVYDPTKETSHRRGNLSFTSVNLPRLAIESYKEGNNSDDRLAIFFNKLKKYEELVFEQLLDRMKLQGKKHVYNFPFLMGQGVYMDSEKLQYEDTLEEIIKHGTLSIGFIGLAECLTMLTGKHHGESDKSWKLGYNIVKYMRDLCDKKCKETNLNFSLLATPAEGLCLSGDTKVCYDDRTSRFCDIKYLKKGMKLYTVNETTGRIELDVVMKCGMTYTSREVIDVHFSNGIVLRCTPNHPIAVREFKRDSLGRFIGGEVLSWKRADSLVIGDRVKAAYIVNQCKSDFVPMTVANITKCADNIPVYDITMKRNHNFFIGDDYKSSILVHNSGRFVSMDKKEFGVIPGVTDKEYYTNSFHIPVKFDISAYDKIDKEAPFHNLTNAGHITYVELDGDPSQNIDAFVDIIKYMADSGIGYGSINHAVDRDPVCGYTGIINDVCPRCGRKENEGIDLDYLIELKKKYPEIRIPTWALEERNKK